MIRNARVVYLKGFSVLAGFTTRHFPLFLQRTDDLKRRAAQVPLKEFWNNTRFIFLNQVHGGKVEVLHETAARQKKTFRCLRKTDGIITNAPKTTLLVLTADCLSIFFCAGSWIGLVHAGWRGTQKKIAQKAFRLMAQHARCKAKDVRIAFGPSIGAKHYEVGKEFLKVFPQCSFRKKKDRLYFDLAGENRRQLLEMGADPDKIIDPGIDTFSDKNFYSFRREKEGTGRIISFIMARSSSKLPASRL